MRQPVTATPRPRPAPRAAPCRGAITLEDRFSAATIEAPAGRRHRVTVAAGWSEGRLSACSIEDANGTRLIRAAADPRMMQGYTVAR